MAQWERQSDGTMKPTGRKVVCGTPFFDDLLEQLDALDTAVYVEARRLGLQDADIPRKDATFHSYEVVFFGRSNVPGLWSSPPDTPSTLTLLATQGWKADMVALRALSQGGGNRETTGIETGGRKVGSVDQRPRKLLNGWHEITQAVSMKYNQRKDVKSLNDRYQGPISNRGAGTHPMVYEDDLIDWWNKLAVKQQELANQREGAKLSAEIQHNYGRDGTAAPEIGGGTKKRRKKRRT